MTTWEIKWPALLKDLLSVPRIRFLYGYMLMMQDESHQSSHMLVSPYDVWCVCVHSSWFTCNACVCYFILGNHNGTWKDFPWFTVLLLLILLTSSITKAKKCTKSQPTSTVLMQIVNECVRGIIMRTIILAIVAKAANMLTPHHLPNCTCQVMSLCLPIIDWLSGIIALASGCQGHPQPGTDPLPWSGLALVDDIITAYQSALLLQWTGGCTNMICQ